MEERITVLFFTHTEYKDLWPCILRNPIPKKIKQMIAVNESIEEIDKNNFVENNFEIISYIDTLSYSEKILNLLKTIQTPYVCFIHDNDIVQTFHEEAFHEILDCLDSHKIDRLMFGIIAKDNADIQHEHFHIGRINEKTTPHFITPYDVGPSIWRVSAFQKAMDCVKGVGYREIETSVIQEFCKTHCNMWGFFSHPKQKSCYVIGRPFPEVFQFLHLCVRGKLLEEDKYMDQKENFLQLLHQYPNLHLRGVLRGQDHIRVDFRTV